VNAPDKLEQAGHGNLDYNHVISKSDYYKQIIRFPRFKNRGTVKASTG